MAFDLLIRGGTIIDGTGAPAVRGDVGIVDGRIAEVGTVSGTARKEIDAAGLLVTPGFIDGHTHMDAQINWDPLGSCSCWHGVTTVVMGNCGFTLAPSREGERELVIRNLERAEDISPAALAQGIEWRWETFPEYLDVLDTLPKGINYAANIGHSALRTWAMGIRAFEEQASEQDLALMSGQLRDALRAGAVGFTTSRTPSHCTSDDKPVASRIASWDEVTQLVGVLAETGQGIFELAQSGEIMSPDPDVRREALDQLEQLAVDTGVPITMGIIPGSNSRESWREQLALFDRAAQRGGTIFGQTHARGINVILSGRTQLPFDTLPSWREVREKPIEEQLRVLRDPAERKRLIKAIDTEDYGTSVGNEARKAEWDLVYILDGPTPPYRTVAEAAAEAGKEPVDLMIDLLIESEFNQFFMQVRAKAEDADLLATMRHPRTVMTFSDTGAHVSQIMDSSLQVHLLAYWARERQAFTVEEAVRMVTSAPARAWGFADRGVIRPGMVADLNVIDFDRLMPGMPHVANDIPGGAKRLVTRAEGIEATIVAGEVLMRRGEHTGALPGRLIRGPLTPARV